MGDVLVHEEGDHGGGHHAEQVGRQALVEAGGALSAVGPSDTVQRPGVLQLPVLQPGPHYL